jgi:hypothetical protein
MLMTNRSGIGDTGGRSVGFSEIKTYSSEVIRLAQWCKELFMKTNQWQRKIGGALFALALLFTTAIALSSAQAQNPNDRHAQDRRDRSANDSNRPARRGRNWDGYGNYGGSAQLRQTALNAGYNEGNKQGHKDRNKRNSNNFQNQSAYQKATKDYNSRLGDREVYQHYFRAAYENGFSDGVNGY